MVKIFVEGKDDKLFVEKYLEYLLVTYQFQPYEIINIGGWTKLHLVDNKFKENTDTGGVNLVLFDTDSSENSGGFTTRSTALGQKKSELNIQFELFLLPNNQDDGDLETLLENIINPEHTILLDCFNQYESCIGGSTDSEGNPKYSLPIRKAKIYSYVDAFPKSSREEESFKRGDYFFENTDYWDLTSSYLVPLREFLLLHLGNST